MNIFFIDKDPHKAARMMVDSHVNKMILESVQMLSTAHRVLDGEMYLEKSAKGRNIKRWRLADGREQILYKATHVNHPSNIWCRQTNNNYNWLLCHVYALDKEFQHRFGKPHKSTELLSTLQSTPQSIRVGCLTPFAIAITNQDYVVDKDPVLSYRKYYKYGKTHLHKYTNREKPEWL